MWGKKIKLNKMSNCSIYWVVGNLMHMLYSIKIKVVDAIMGSVPFSKLSVLTTLYNTLPIFFCIRLMFRVSRSGKDAISVNVICSLIYFQSCRLYKEKKYYGVTVAKGSKYTKGSVLPWYLFLERRKKKVSIL